jgi:hypothetical protein
MPGESIIGPPGPAGTDGRDALQIDILPAADFSKSYPRGTYARFDGGVIRSFRDTIPGERLEKAGWEVIVSGVAEIRIEQSHEDPRSFTVSTRMTGGEHSFIGMSIPAMIYKEIYRAGVDYRKGDVVTWDGSAWHCQVDHPSFGPGKSADWKMMVKEGRRGKDGKDGERGPQGPPGKDGRDLTQLAFDGKKY